MLGIFERYPRACQPPIFLGYCWHSGGFVVVRTSVTKTIQRGISVGKNSRHCWDRSPALDRI